MPARMAHVDDFVHLVGLALANSREMAQVRGPLERHGYGDGRLGEGDALMERVRELMLRQRMAQGAKAGALQRQRQAREQLELLYMRHLAIARMVFRDEPASISLLGLAGARKLSLAGIMGQAHQFYQHARSDERRGQALAEYGVTRSEVERGQALVEALQHADMAYLSARVDAKSATAERDAALRALHEWFRCFVVVARVALADHPAWLPALGIR